MERDRQQHKMELEKIRVQGEVMKEVVRNLRPGAILVLNIGGSEYGNMLPSSAGNDRAIKY